MSNVFVGVALLAILAGIYFIGRIIVALVRKEPFGVFVKKIFIAAAVVIVAAVGSSATQTPEQKAAIEEKREAKAQAQADKQTAGLKAAEEKRIAEENRIAEEKRLAEEKRAAEIERNRQNAEENRRKLEENHRRQEETRAANRLTIEEFESHIMLMSNVESMGTPDRRVAGQDVTLIYPMTDNFDMTVVTTGGKVKRAIITVHNVNRGSLGAAVLLYDAVVSAYADANAIFGALGLDETIVDTIAEYRTTTVNGYRFEKKLTSSKAIVLSVGEI